MTFITNEHMISITNATNFPDRLEFNIPAICRLRAPRSWRLNFSASLFVTLVAISPVRADWLVDMWSNEHASRYGSPAITLNAASGVTIVLPEASITEAQAAGLSPQQAALAFLSKYGPEMCSKIIDLNESTPALTIKLIVQYMHADGLNVVFEASPHKEVWTIDYVPTHRAWCVAPPDDFAGE